MGGMGDSDLFNDWYRSAAMSTGWGSVLNIVITVLCIWAAWWALQTFRFDLFVKQPKSAQARALMIMISIALGYSVARFVIDYLGWALLLKWLV